jgi:hypothetical protein
MIMIARKFALLRQLAWAATLATGFATLWSALVLWLATSIQEASQGGRRHWPPREDVVVKSDGTPLIQTTSAENYSVSTYRDLAGRAHAAPERSDLAPAVYLTGQRPTPGFFSWRPGWAQRLKVFMDEREPTANWFFVHDGKMEGAGYFVGYERETNRRLGFIGLSGFRANPVPSDEWIPVRGALIMGISNWSSAPLSIYFSGERGFQPDRGDLPPRLVYVPSGNHLREVDLSAHTVTTVFETPEPIESPGIPALSSWSVGHRMSEQPILVRTRQHIYALDRKHSVIRLFTIPAESDRGSLALWYEIGNGEAIADFFSDPSRHTVYRIANDGSIKDRFELTLQTGVPATNNQTRAFLTALALPAPAILLAVDLAFVTEVDQEQSYPAAITALLKDSGPTLISIFALSSILAIMSWRWTRSFGLSRREQMTWVVFVLLFGLPACVGFLVNRRWPIRELCPNCHARSPRDRVACAECGTRFPDPALKGIEIFA